MKALILAAGMGTRLGKYTRNLPKGMLSFNGKPLIEWQIQQLRKAGITDISIVTGYQREKIAYPGVGYFHNPDFASTNMVESMLCARDSLHGADVLVSYSDILFTGDLVALACRSCGDIGVAVDRDWRTYWMERYGTTETDLESLTVKDNVIVELGKPMSSSADIDYRYIGMIRFSSAGMAKALEIYDRKKAADESWRQSGKSFRNGYMTDLLNELIVEGNSVLPIVSDGDWLEFDTNEDYEVTLKLLQEGKISSRFFE
jgi:L-glutamine-phosphate cytidylyltransferase